MTKTVTKLTEEELMKKYGITYSDDWQQLNDNFDKEDRMIFYSSGCMEDIERAIEGEKDVVDLLPPLIFICVGLNEDYIAFY